MRPIAPPRKCYSRTAANNLSTLLRSLYRHLFSDFSPVSKRGALHRSGTLRRASPKRGRAHRVLPKNTRQSDAAGQAVRRSNEVQPASPLCRCRRLHAPARGPPLASCPIRLERGRWRRLRTRTARDRWRLSEARIASALILTPERPIARSRPRLSGPPAGASPRLSTPVGCCANVDVRLAATPQNDADAQSPVENNCRP
jgi:hypothetical protein